MQVTLILLDGIPSLGQLIMPALTLAINLSFYFYYSSSIRATRKVSAKEKKISHNYGMDLYR